MKFASLTVRAFSRAETKNGARDVVMRVKKSSVQEL
jgi:hypothetical protein